MNHENENVLNGKKPAKSFNAVDVVKETFYVTQTNKRDSHRLEAKKKKGRCMEIHIWHMIDLISHLGIFPFFSGVKTKIEMGFSLPIDTNMNEWMVLLSFISTRGY